MYPLADHFVGPISVAFSQRDAVAMAKALTEYAKKEPKLNVRVGFVEGQVLAPGQITALADLPPREVLLGRMLSEYAKSAGRFRGCVAGSTTAACVCFTGSKGCQRASQPRGPAS